MRSNYTLNAGRVAVEDMEDSWLVGFADYEFQTKHYLMLQRSFEDDEQDIRLGLHTYHVEIDDQRQSCYGGITLFQLLRNRALVSFSQKGAEQLGHAQAEVRFQVDDVLFAELQSQLQKIFKGTGVYSADDVQPAV